MIRGTRTQPSSLQSLRDSSKNLAFGGGVDGITVTTGAPRVYLVFWGSQWGNRGTDGHGDATFSGDPAGMGPALQAFMRGLGTGGETWSGVMTQYCEGVAVGSQHCPSGASHVGYPAGGALAGVWEDTSSAAPSAATANRIGREAVAAATHFGNAKQASSRNTQYVIVSPTGANPDHYLTQGFCAWHDSTGDATLDGGGAVTSPDGELAFTNLPYLPDAGAGCGRGFLNGGAAGALDGVTIVESHEYAETITDPFPGGGWTDAGGNENGDKCAWIQSGQGAAKNISLSTGTFAVQSTWANDFKGGSGGCETSHAVVRDLGTPSSPTKVSATPGTGSAKVSWSAPESDGGSTVTKYTVTASPGDASCTTAATHCTLRGLNPTIGHIISIVATNGFGHSAPSSSPVVYPFAPRGLGIEVVTPVLSAAAVFTVIVGGAVPGTSVRVSMPGAPASRTCTADAVGQCVATMSTPRSGVSTLRATSGMGSSSLKLYVPVVTAPTSVWRGSPARISVTYCPAGAMVSLMLSDGARFATTASSAGVATVHIATPRVARLAVTTTVNGIVLSLVRHVNIT